jgi:peptide/nickel transport system substrate-binding protein
MAAGKVSLVDAGISVSPDWLVFNLVPGAKAALGRPWLQREELRRAVSYAVDRQALVDTIYLGAAVPVFGPITPGHGQWYLADGPRTDRDEGRARALLATLGLTDHDGNGTVEDAAGAPARFSMLVQKGTLRERVAIFLKDQLAKVGLTVDVVALDQPSLIDHWQRADYDAMYHYILFDNPDPARNLEFWMSSGGFHFWHPGQATPATPWETSLDALMTRVSTTMDENARRETFAEAQRVLAEHLPIVYFVAPRVLVPMSGRLRGATPTVILPLTVLWNADSLSIAPNGRSPQGP